MSFMFLLEFVFFMSEYSFFSFSKLNQESCLFNLGAYTITEQVSWYCMPTGAVFPHWILLRSNELAVLKCFGGFTITFDLGKSFLISEKRKCTMGRFAGNLASTETLLCLNVG